MFTIINRADPDTPSLTPREIAVKIASEHPGPLTIDHLVRAVEYERAQTEDLHMNQTQTLSYLGIEFEDGTADEGSPAWYLPAQTIEKEYCFHGDVVVVGQEPDGSAIYRCNVCGDTWNESED